MSIENPVDFTQKVLDRIIEFKFGDDGSKAKAFFSDFANEHEKVFEDNCQSENQENKLEYISIYNKFCVLFDRTLETIITEQNSKATIDDFIKGLQ